MARVCMAPARSQDQYVLEGVVVAALNVLTGLSCALTIVLASSKRYTIVQYIGTSTITTTQRATATRLEPHISQRVRAEAQLLPSCFKC